MDLFLALHLAHALSAIAWIAGGAVLALILLAARRDAAAAARALPEARLIGDRVLRPMGLATALTGLGLAALAGLALEAWVLLAAAVVLGSLAARSALLEPAFARGAAGPALRLAALDLLAQGAAAALMVLRPGWAEAAILGGLLACLLLAAALLRSLGETAQPA